MEKMLLKVVLFCVWHLVGVFGSKSMVPKSVMEEDSVTLDSRHHDLKGRDQVKWMYGQVLLAVMNGTVTVHNNGRFKDRLKLDKQTGSLTITNVTTEDAGYYTADFTSQTNPTQINFILMVYNVLTFVMEGELDTMVSGVTETHNENLQWRYDREKLPIDFSHDTDWRFKDNLSLNYQIRSVTIKNNFTEQAGLFKYLIFGVKTSSKAFNVVVFAHQPFHFIRGSKCFASLQNCSVACSVVNASHVTLSWLKGNSLLSSITVSDHSISLALPLEVDDQLINDHICMVNYNFYCQVTDLDISDLCQTSEGSTHCCGSTEAAIRLVLSALVGVATVIVVVYDIRSR